MERRREVQRPSVGRLLVAWQCDLVAVEGQVAQLHGEVVPELAAVS